MSSATTVRVSLRESILDLDAGRDGINGPCQPLPVHTSIAFDLAQGTAYFRLRATLSQPLSDLPAPHGQYIYLDISPEQVPSLSYCRLPYLEKMQQRPATQDPPAIPTISLQSGPCICLIFHIQSVLFTIPPNSYRGDKLIHIYSEEDRRVFEGFRSISVQSGLYLVLYSTELVSALAVDQLDRLCSAVSTRNLKPNLILDPQRLYNGRGGTIIAPNDTIRYDHPTAGAEDVVGSAGSPPESPPSYEQADPPPPLAPFSPEPRSMKRARTSTPSTESAGPVIDAQSLDFIIQRAISSAEARFQQELSRQRGAMAATEARLQEELRSQKDAMVATEARLQEELGREISALRVELVAHIDGKLVEYVRDSDMEVQLDEHLDLKTVDLVTGAELQEYVNDFLDQQNEELVTRTEMEEFVEDRLESTSENLRNRILKAFDGQ